MDICGNRDAKFKAIAQVKLPLLIKNDSPSSSQNVNTTYLNNFSKLTPNAPFYLFTPQNQNVRAKYDEGISLRDIFIESNVGALTGRDNICIGLTHDAMVSKVNEFIHMSEDEVFAKYKVCNVRDWNVKDAQQDVKNVDVENVISINYRIFDKRYTYYTKNSRGFMQYPRYDIMKHLLNRDNIGLVFVRNKNGAISYNYNFISKDIIDAGFCGGTTYISPLYLYQENMGIVEKVVNFKESFINALQTSLNATLILPNGQGATNNTINYITPEQVLGYIYAQLHSNYYRTTYLDFVKIDFPKINFNVSLKQFNRLANIGEHLISLHIIDNKALQQLSHLNMGEPETEEKIANYICEKPIFNEQNNRLYFNKTSYFSNVSKNVYNFKIGGYQVLDKYLKDRKTISLENDLTHIQNIIKVLHLSLAKIKEIDE